MAGTPFPPDTIPTQHSHPHGCLNSWADFKDFLVGVYPWVGDGFRLKKILMGQLKISHVVGGNVGWEWCRVGKGFRPYHQPLRAFEIS